MPSLRPASRRERSATRPRWHRRTRQAGQGAIEYALLLMLIGSVAVGVATRAGSYTNLAFCSVANGLGGDGSVAMWGDDTYGQLGNGSTGVTEKTATALN